MTTASLLYLGNKDFEETQLIVIFIKLANLAKRVIYITIDLAMMPRKKDSQQQSLESRLNIECFNYSIKSNYTRNCLYCTNSKRKSKDKKMEYEAKCKKWNKNQTLTNRVVIAKSNASNKKSNDDFYLTKRVLMIQKAITDQSNLYLDSCAFKHICNKRDNFSKLCPKSSEFVTINKNIIRWEKVGIIQLVLLNGSDITLLNIVFVLRCNSKLISLGQLKEARILYHNYPKKMILKKAENIIG